MPRVRAAAGPGALRAGLPNVRPHVGLALAESSLAVTKEHEPAWMDDPTILLDGTKCVECGGTVVAEPVELYEAAILRCRDCGALT